MNMREKMIFGLMMIATIGMVGILISKSTPNSSEGIHVHGEATVFVDPDTLTITFGVEETKHTSLEVQQNINEITTSLISTFKEMGVKSGDIKTTNLNIYPEYKRNEETEERETIGYHGSEYITVTLHDENFESLGESLLAVAPTLGNVTVQNTIFSLSKQSKGQDEARALAIESAFHKAEELAKNTNITLGEVIDLSENSNGNRYYTPTVSNTYAMSKMMFEDSMETGEGISLEKGKNEVVVSVDITYAIK